MYVVFPILDHLALKTLLTTVSPPPPLLSMGRSLNNIGKKRPKRILCRIVL